jgi:hypothetical protein
VRRPKDPSTRGMSRTPTYVTWVNMMARCHNPKNSRYRQYGGRGIFVCESWQKFSNFLCDMGERPAELTIERIDNDKGYEPSNCKWATRREQQINRRSCRMLEWNGKLLPMAKWDRLLGFNKDVVRKRLRSGWSVERTLTTPLDERRSSIARVQASA